MRRLLSLFVLILVLSPAISLADSVNDIDQPNNDTFEIRDKSNEITLGVTESTVYMIVSEELKNQMNQDLEEAYTKDLESFNESNGSFIMGSYVPLVNTRIEYHRDDIFDIYLSNGIIQFEYNNVYSIVFDDIKASNGKSALANFSKDDIQDFIGHFNKS